MRCCSVCITNHSSFATRPDVRGQDSRWPAETCSELPPVVARTGIWAEMPRHDSAGPRIRKGYHRRARALAPMCLDGSMAIIPPGAFVLGQPGVSHSSIWIHPRAATLRIVSKVARSRRRRANARSYPDQRDGRGLCCSVLPVPSLCTTEDRTSHRNQLLEFFIEPVDRNRSRRKSRRKVEVSHRGSCRDNWITIIVAIVIFSISCLSRGVVGDP